jgi:hypothetical protein
LLDREPPISDFTTVTIGAFASSYSEQGPVCKCYLVRLTVDFVSMIAGFRFIIHDHVPGEPSHSDPRTHEKRDAPLPNDPNAIVRAEKEPSIRGDPLDQRRVRLHPPPPFHATVTCTVPGGVACLCAWHGVRRQQLNLPTNTSLAPWIIGCVI